MYWVSFYFYFYLIFWLRIGLFDDFFFFLGIETECLCPYGPIDISVPSCVGMIWGLDFRDP